MLAMIRGLLALTVSLISNMTILMMFWEFAWICTPLPRWQGIYRILTVLHVSPTHENVIFHLALFTFLIPCLLYRTAPAQRIMLWLFGARKAKGDELTAIEDALFLVCERTGTTTDDFNLYVQDEEYANAAAFGDNHIIVTRPLLKTVDTEELAGILAHEVGHLYNGDTRILSLLACMGFFGETALNILCFVTRVCCWLSWVPIINIAAAILSWIIVIATALVQFIVYVPANLIMLFFSRQDEYDADRFACEIGLARELYDGLDIMCLDEKRTGFCQNLWSTHPVTKKRLERIQKYICKEK